MKLHIIKSNRGHYEILSDEMNIIFSECFHNAGANTLTFYFKGFLILMITNSLPSYEHFLSVLNSASLINEIG